MEREIIEVINRDFAESLVCGENDDFIYIDEVQTDLNLERGYAELYIILQRVSDSKFFKFYYTKMYDDNEYDSKLIEVFPKQVTITVYE